MIEVRGSYLGGETSSSIEARLVCEGERVVVEATDGSVLVDGQAHDLKIESKLGNTPRRIQLGAAGVFVSDDSAGVDAFARHLGSGQNLGWVAWLEARWPVALLALVITFGGLGAFAYWGVPALAKMGAQAVPPWASEKLGLSTLDTIDRILDPTELDEAERDRLSAYFRSYGDVAHIEYRKAGPLGANALTLSADVVVFTDELVALAERDEELLAVYLHELGHARLKHVETTILQNSAWIVLFSLLVGDFSGMGEVLVSVPIAIGQAAFSKQHEREADRFAIEALIANGIDPTPLADILQKLEASHLNESDEDSEVDDSSEIEMPSVEDLEEGARERQVEDQSPDAVVDESAPEGDAEDERMSRILFDYFSTHPATEERVDTILAAAREAGLSP